MKGLGLESADYLKTTCTPLLTPFYKQKQRPQAPSELSYGAYDLTEMRVIFAQAPQEVKNESKYMAIVNMQHSRRGSVKILQQQHP